MIEIQKVGMNKILRYSLVVATLLYFGGCAVTTLTLDSNNILLHIDGKDLKTEGKSISKEFNNFGKLFLTQNIVKLSDQSIVVYEKVVIDSSYELNFPTKTTISILFGAKSITPIYINKGLHIYQIRLKDGKVLNLIAEQFADQQISFVYGMSTKQIKKILQELDAESRYPLIDRVVKLENNKKSILSKWSMKMVNFAPLITPQRLGFGF